MRNIFLIYFVICFLNAAAGEQTATGAKSPSASSYTEARLISPRKTLRISDGIGFVQLNDGSKGISFYRNGLYGHVIANSQGIALQHPNSLRQNYAFELKFIASNNNAHIMGLDPLPGTISYYVGEARNWQSDLPHFSKVQYKQIYKGVDLILYNNEAGQVEYDFIVNSLEDLKRIRIQIVGTTTLRINPAGSLVAENNEGQIIQTSPVFYQTISGHKSTLSGHIAVDANNEISFHVDKNYDSTIPLIIDPAIQFSTYFGGQKQDYAEAITVDRQGFIYIAGDTESANLSVIHALQVRNAGGTDAYVAKIDPKTSSLIYCTFLGGRGSDGVFGIQADAGGNLYLAGGSSSHDFPVLNAWQPRFNGGLDVILLKLDPVGKLLFSTFFGGKGSEAAIALALNKQQDSIWITGYTSSRNLPLFNPVQGKSKGGGDDAFIAGFKSDGSTPVFSTYFGGNNVDSGAGIALDRTGNVYIVGSTFSQTFPTVNSFQPQYNDNKDAFLAKIDPLKPKIIYSTFLGGSSVEEPFAIDVTRRGKAAVVGWTDSKDFPLTNAVDNSPKPTDGFVSEISPTGKLLFSTYLGGGGPDQALGVKFDRYGKIYVAGLTKSTDFPLLHSIQKKLSKGKTLAEDAFLTKFSRNGQSILFSTYLGGSEDDWGFALALDGSGNAYICGRTGSTDFPIRRAFQKELAGKRFHDHDVFVTEINNP